MKPFQLLLPLLLVFQLSACSSSDDPASVPAEDGDDDTTSLPADGDDDTTSLPADGDDDNTTSLPADGDDDDDPAEVPSETPTVLQTPDYRGELTFASTRQVDLDPMITDAGLNRVDSYQLSRDGTTIRADVLNDDNDVAAIALVDTSTGDASWLLTDIAENTSIIFDAENSPAAVVGLSCATVSYTATFDDSLFDLSTLSAADRCIYKDFDQSADGNVVIFRTYDPTDLSQYGTPNSTTLHAYTLDSASLVDFPDVSLTIDDVILSPRYSGMLYDGYALSDDGQLLLSKQWWEGTDLDGNTVRQVGATLWNTLSGEWVVRGQAEDLRGCTITDKVTCQPPYSYALSNDGSRQYAEVPVGEQLENRPSYENFASLLQFAETGSTTETPIDGTTGTVQSMVTNQDGDQLVIFSGIYDNGLEAGYSLYQQSSDSLLSLNRALRACALTDDNGIEIDESECEYTTVPGAITSNAEYYTADGQHVLFRSISRFTADLEQAVDQFLLDVEDAAMYTLPEFYGERNQWISGDGSVLMGLSDYPEYDILIGRR